MGTTQNPSKLARSVQDFLDSYPKDRRVHLVIEEAQTSNPLFRKRILRPHLADFKW